MARITHYPDYDALAAATASGDAAVIAAVTKMRKAHRDRCAGNGTKWLWDGKSPWGHPDTAPIANKVYKNQLPENGDGYQPDTQLTRVYNGAGKIIGVSANNAAVRQMIFPVSAKLPSGTLRVGFGATLTINSATAANTRMLLSWGDGTTAAQRAFGVILGATNALSIGINGREAAVVPVIAPGVRYIIGAEAVFAGVNSIHRVFLNGAQVGADVIFDGTAGLNQPAAHFCFGGCTGYYSTANSNTTLHRVMVDDLTASNRTMQEYMTLETARNLHRFDY